MGYKGIEVTINCFCGKQFTTYVLGETTVKCPYCGKKYKRIYVPEIKMYEYYLMGEKPKIKD